MTVSFDAVWAAAVEQHRDLPFLLFSSRDGRVDEWTCGEVDDVVARAGGALRDAGVGPGTAVQMVLGSCPAFVAVWSAVSRLGGWMLPVDPASTRRDLARQVVRIHPAAVLIGHDQAIVFGEAVPGFSGQVLVLGEDSADLAPGAPLHSGNPVRALPEPGPDRCLAVVFTSGTTETVAPVRTDTSQPPAHDVIGRPMPGRHVRVVGLVLGADVPAGVPGELVVRGARGRDLFASCLDDDAVNARVLTSDGDLAWFRTGDLVSCDSDGVLRFVGRVDDVVKVSGENVSLTEVEAVAAQAPGVLEVAVIATADETRDTFLSRASRPATRAGRRRPRISSRGRDTTSLLPRAHASGRSSMRFRGRASAKSDASASRTPRRGTYEQSTKNRKQRGAP